ncbi:hypothetical protein [Escherichia phage vB_EcoM-LTH01]
MEYCRKNSSLKWYDYLYFRVMEKFKGVNELSIESGDMEDLLKKNEYIDIQEYLEGVQEKEKEYERQRMEQQEAQLKRRK